MRILTPAPGKQEIPLFQIAGPEPRGRCLEHREQLITAIRLSSGLRLSFQGMSSVGDQFLISCLGPALFFAASNGQPVRAINLSPSLAADLHTGLLEIGALLPDLDRDRILGASERLVAAHRAVRAGAETAPALASALGTSALTAGSDLRLLEHWGVGPAKQTETFAEDLAVAA